MRSIAALFSMLMPGVGQMYNNQFVKGVVFLIIEHYDNVFGTINKAIHMDFNGAHAEALKVVDYQYLLFYPGFYAFCVWDAWFHAKAGANKTTTAITFLIAGFLGKFAAIFSAHLPIPSLTCGLVMVIPMLAGMFIFRKQ